VLEEDESKVNSTTLEPSFNFEGANLNGANFSKAKFIVPKSKDEMTVEEALTFVDRDFKKEKKANLSEAKQEINLVDRVLMEDRAKRTCAQNESKKEALKKWMEALFGDVKSIDNNTTFSENQALNKDFRDEIQDRINKNDQNKPTANPFAKIIDGNRGKNR
jgi:hypothetical protein